MEGYGIYGVNGIIFLRRRQHWPHGPTYGTLACGMWNESIRIPESYRVVGRQGRVGLLTRKGEYQRVADIVSRDSETSQWVRALLPEGVPQSLRKTILLIQTIREKKLVF